jgi:hypothetical protein
MACAIDSIRKSPNARLLDATSERPQARVFGIDSEASLNGGAGCVAIA